MFWLGLGELIMVTAYFLGTPLLGKGSIPVYLQLHLLIRSKSLLYLLSWCGELLTQLVKLNITAIATTIGAIGTVLHLRDGCCHGP